MWTEEHVIYASTRGLHGFDHFGMDGIQCIEVEVTAVDTGLVGDDDDLVTGIVQPLDGFGSPVEHVEFGRVVTIRGILCNRIVSVHHHTLLAEHLTLDDSTDCVTGAEVTLLDTGGLLGRDHYSHIGHLTHDPAVTGEGYGDGPELLGPLHCKDHILGISGSGQSDDDVPLSAMCLDLPLEDEIVGIVVSDGGHGGDVGKRHPGHRGTVHHVFTGEFGRDMLGIGGRTPVPHEDDLVAGPHGPGDDLRRLANLLRIDGGYCLSAALQLRFDGINHRHTSMMLRPKART